MTWRALEEEFARWRAAGRTPDFWWRDDDATKPTPELRRLLALSASSNVPLALAVIPLAAVPELFAELSASVLMHGTDHRNRAAAGEKKTEFAVTEGEDAALARLASGRARLAALAGGAFVPVLAPPWNRVKPSLVPRLASAGLRGLSRYGARASGTRAEVNTHVDIIDWRGSRGFCGEQAALALAVRHLAARRTGAADAEEPTGVLTHHAVHDAAAWDFLEQLFARTRRLGASWREAGELFPSAS
ncbi:MAG TPA: hypothetical protein VFK84_18425 [Burkholderiales bacterium]|nr:hypothetical protein [Burkholderiales bacterium]